MLRMLSFFLRLLHSRQLLSQDWVLVVFIDVISAQKCISLVSRRRLLALISGPFWILFVFEGLVFGEGSIIVWGHPFTCLKFEILLSYLLFVTSRTVSHRCRFPVGQLRCHLGFIRILRVPILGHLLLNFDALGYCFIFFVHPVQASLFFGFQGIFYGLFMAHLLQFCISLLKLLKTPISLALNGVEGLRRYKQRVRVKLILLCCRFNWKSLSLDRFTCRWLAFKGFEGGVLWRTRFALYFVFGAFDHL